MIGTAKTALIQLHRFSLGLSAGPRGQNFQLSTATFVSR
eukprot:COSAG02_NODE_66982_length_254_cov_0.658065_1_plen_38_part_01